VSGFDKRVTYAGRSDYSWLGSANSKVLGFDSGEFDVDLFRGADLCPHGVILSGTAVCRLERGGRLGPFDVDATDGRGVLCGFVFGDVRVSGRTRVRGEVLVRGPVLVERLPGSVPTSAFDGRELGAVRGE